jgi:hypothetical protein
MTILSIFFGRKQLRHLFASDFLHVILILYSFSCSSFDLYFSPSNCLTSTTHFHFLAMYIWFSLSIYKAPYKKQALPMFKANSYNYLLSESLIQTQDVLHSIASSV